ncbi:hypothetical protein [Alkalicoccus chagannorensis]|uniref:hypothetical protein n=1 Tax=Alkalicoccus chagannorensis TaxID=427072 RepID=UPI000402D452|nr:hypothetical protein [Alkalicoccus chagannorensis]
MSGNEKAVNKLAQRVLDGYEAVHQKEYSRARQLLEPMVPMLHTENKPNAKLLCYTAIAQIGDKDAEAFLSTMEHLKPLTPKDNQEKKLIERVDEMFQELMETLEDDGNEKQNNPLH